MNDLPISVIEEGCSFEGNLVFRGTVRLGGKFKGKIFTSDTLVITNTANIEAEIEGDIVVISGHFAGNIKATTKIDLQSGAVVSGNLEAPIVSMADGVVFDGKIKMD